MNKSLRPETRDKKCRGTSGIGKVHAVFDRLGVVTAYREILAIATAFLSNIDVVAQ